MVSKRNARRNGAHREQVAQISTDGSESLEARQMLSGDAINNPGQVIDNAVEEHASNDAKKAVSEAEQKVQQAEQGASDAADNVQTAKDDLKKAEDNKEAVERQANADADAKQKIADDAQAEADRKQAEADAARDKQKDLEDKAKAERDAQQAAKDDIEGPAILRYEPGGQPTLAELTEDQLRERRRNAETYLHNQDLNVDHGNLTPRQRWGRHDKRAEIFEVDAELARREADAKQAEADEAQQKANEAQACADAVKQDGQTRVAAAMTAVNNASNAVQSAEDKETDAGTSLDNANSELADAKAAAAGDAAATIKRKKAGAQQQLDDAKKKLQQKVEDIQKAMYFAWLLGMTPRSFDADDLAAWKAQVQKIGDLVKKIPRTKGLSRVLGEAIKVAAEAVTVAISGMRATRLRQMEFEINGIDISTGRRIFENQTASEWIQNGKHGENAAGSHEEAVRIMRILVDWHKNGYDLSRSLAPEIQCVQEAAARVQALCDQMESLSQAIHQQAAEGLDGTYGFRFDQNYYEDWAGQGEKWFRGDDGWFYITPNGGVFHWHGGRGDNLRSTQVGQLDSSWHANPDRVHDAVERLLHRHAEQLDQDLGLRHTENYFEDWAGRGEKWIRGTDGWYFVTPAGSLYKWNSGRFDNLKADHIADLDASYHVDPVRLHNATAIRLDSDLQLSQSGSYFHNWGGQNEKWLQGDEAWYWLNDIGQLYRWNDGGSRSDMLGSSTLIADGLDDFFSNPALLHEAA